MTVIDKIQHGGINLSYIKHISHGINNGSSKFLTIQSLLTICDIHCYTVLYKSRHFQLGKREHFQYDSGYNNAYHGTHAYL